MADQSTSKAISGLTAREQEILVAALTKCLKSGDIQIDFAKLATETGLKDAKSANAVWGHVKKKLFSIASTQSGGAGGTPNRVTKPNTPRKPKEPKQPKSPVSTTKKAAKSSVKVEEQEDEVASDREANSNESRVKVEINVTNDAALSPSEEMNNDRDPTTTDGQGDYAMGHPLEHLGKGKGKASTVDEMSSGDMSPPTTPAPTKAGKVTTPKVKHITKSPKTPKTPTGEAANTSPGDAIKTPVPLSSSGKKRGRKTKAQKEAEAAATADQNGVVQKEDDDEQEEGKSAKKPRRATAKKVKKDVDTADGDDADTVEGEDVEETAGKKPRKMSAKKAKTDTTAESREGNRVDTNNEKGEQTDSPMKKPGKASVKKAKKEVTSPAIERNTASNAAKESDKAGPKLGAPRAKNAAAVLPTEPDTSRKGPEQEKMDQDTVAMVHEAAVLTNEVLEGKEVAAKTASAPVGTAALPDWGTPVNGCGANPSGNEDQVESAANGDTNVLASNIPEPIECEDEVGDTITVAAA